MDTLLILWTLRDFSFFIDAFPSDLLPESVTQTTSSVIVNADPHTEGGSHWLAVHFRPKSSSDYYFDSYGIVPLVPSIQAFMKRNCTICEYNRRQLQGLTTDVCGKYSCIFALYMDRGYTPQQFISLFDTCNLADQEVERLYTIEFGAQKARGGWGQCCRSCL